MIQTPHILSRMCAFSLALFLLSRGTLSFQPSAMKAIQHQRRYDGLGSTNFAAISSTESSEPVSSFQDVVPKESGSRIVKSRSSRVAVLVCPAQFCVPDDYSLLFDNLKDLANSEDPSQEKLEGLPVIGTCKVAPLPRTEWIKVAKQLPTKDFLDATLPVHSTLGWYFDAIESGLAEIFAEEGPNVRICIVGHSIGGWVARAYLGGLSRSSSAVSKIAARQCSSLITLGTPHRSPESALVDQTRGLLREIAEAESCSSQALTDRAIDVTCVCSSGLSGSFVTLDVEEVVAASSYLPLLGSLKQQEETSDQKEQENSVSSSVAVKGDGIVPLDLAFMEPPARKVVIDKCLDTGATVRHSHVLPTPWNLWDGYAPSIRLPQEFASYVSEGVLPQWVQYIR